MASSDVRRLRVLLGFLVALPVLAACGDGDDGTGPNQAPEVEITAPSDGATFQADAEITLRGSALDPEEGQLGGSALTWTSSQDGEIASGAEATVTGLSVATHQITLTATDSEGAQGSATVEITVETDEADIDGTTTVGGDTTYTDDVTVGSEGDLTVEGEEVRIEGDLTVEEGGRIRGTGEMLSLVVEGDATISGDVASSGHLVLASSADAVPPADSLDSPPRESGAVPVEASAPSSDSTTWEIDGSLQAGATVAGAPAASRAADGEDGADGKTLWLQQNRGNVVLRGNYAAPNGKPGGDADGCDVTAGDGGDGGHIQGRVHGNIKFSSATFTGGNGGDGGRASGDGCPDGSTNTGGQGGEPGSVYFVVRGQAGAGGGGDFIVDGELSFDGVDAGDGGDARITGRDDKPGATVTAEAGRGGKVPQSSFVIWEPPTTFMNNGSIDWNVLNGGDGGTATEARGGDGVDGGWCRDGFDGGDGIGNGGDGGDVTVGQIRIRAAAFGNMDFSDSFQAGDGGDANGTGGNGGDGGDCKFGAPGAGGSKGTGSASAGTAGTAQVPGTNFSGTDGTAGGASATDGTPGADGIAIALVLYCFDFEFLEADAEGNVAPGEQEGPLFNEDGTQQVGTMAIRLPDGAFKAENETPNTLWLQNGESMVIDLGSIQGEGVQPEQAKLLGVKILPQTTGGFSSDHPLTVEALDADGNVLATKKIAEVPDNSDSQEKTPLVLEFEQTATEMDSFFDVFSAVRLKVPNPSGDVFLEMEALYVLDP